MTLNGETHYKKIILKLNLNDKIFLFMYINEMVRLGYQRTQ
jgi:hypothetical protein